MDAKIVGLITAGTVALIGAVKKAFPSWADGKEELLALLIPILSVIGLKLAGAIETTEWPNAVIWAVGMGLGAQLGHDKVLNPVIKGRHAPPAEPPEAPKV